MPGHRDGIALPDIHTAWVDGVPTLWADVPGPFYAALVFRAGRGDERLSTAGISHLAEHLAVPYDTSHLIDVNAMVDLTTTSFVASGDERTVCDYLRELALRLQSLDTDRLGHEAQVLIQEEASSGPNAAGEALRIRYGARAYGLAGFDSLGLYRVTPLELSEWASKYFVSENACLILSGEPPASLSLPLKNGSRVLAPPPPDTVIPLPFVAQGLPGAVVLSIVTRRSPAAGMALRIVADRLLRRLRHELATTYGVEASNEDLGAEHVHRVLLADVRDGHEARVVSEMIDVIDEVADNGPSEEEREQDVIRFVRQHEDPASAIGLMHFLAEQQLAGRTMTPADALALIESVTVDAMSAALRSARDSMLLLAPEGTVEMPEPWHTEVPEAPDQPFDGRVFRPAGLRNALNPDRLVVGDAGISVKLSRPWQNMAWDRVETLLENDGHLVLIAEDGSWLEVNPDGWSDGADLGALIRRSVPLSRHVTVPKRNQ